MAFPTSLDSFPSATTLAANNLNTDPHSTLHGNLGNAVAALEAKLGADSSAVTTSVDYKIGHLGGDLTGTVTAATIGSAAVSLPKMANLAANTFIGNNTASPATPMALTVTQAKALLAITTADVSGAVAIANGGTGQTTQQAALDALAGAQTTNQVLAGNGTHITLRALAAADVPSLPESQITNLVSDLAAKSLRLTPTTVKTTGYTAVSGDYVGCDTTSAGFTVTLPTAPTDGTTIAVALVKQSGTNAVTVAAGGSDVFDVAAGTTTATIGLLFQTETFQYKASTSIWYRTSSRFPRTQLYSSFSGDATVNSSGVVTLAGSANVESIIRANSPDQLTPAAANVNLNSFKIISLANGTTSTDAVAYGQALIKAGIAGGQTAIGGSAASENLTLQSTSHATRGNVLMVDSPIVDNLTSVGAGAVIGSLLFRARDNEGSPVVAKGGLIQAVVDTNSAWSILNWPSRLEFYSYNAPGNTQLNVMTIDSNGSFYTSPVIAANVVSTYGVKIDSSGNVASVASIKSTSATSGVGYATGAGGAVTQLTSKSTAFPTISKVCGTLTWNGAALAASTSVTAASSTNAAIAATDTVVFNHVSGGTLGAYTMTCTPAGGTWTLTLRNVSTGSLSEAPVFAFSIIKAVTS